MARPRKDVNWDAVEKLCGLQCTETEIAEFLGLSIATLYRACKREHKMGFDEYFGQKRGIGKISLRRAQWQLATQNKNPTMLIWLGKQHLAQADKAETVTKAEHTFPQVQKNECADRLVQLKVGRDDGKPSE